MTSGRHRDGREPRRGVGTICAGGRIARRSPGTRFNAICDLTVGHQLGLLARSRRADEPREHLGRYRIRTAGLERVR